MKKQNFVDRISFPTEYNDKSELKTSIVLLFITCLFFFVLSSAMIVLNLFLFSKTLLLGTIAYELILFYLLNEYIKKFIQKEVKEVKAKKTLDVTSSLIFTALMILTFLTLVYTMITPSPVIENKFVSLSAALLLIVLPTFFWHELVMFFKKKVSGKIKLLGSLFLICLLFTPVAFAEDTNVTVNATSTDDFFSKLSLGLDTLQKGVGYFNQVSELFNKTQAFVQANLNLTADQSNMVMIIVALIGAFFLLKFLSFIVKWVIVILIAWIVLQMFFL